MFEDENGNRPGDWTHRAQRKQQANTIVGKDDAPKDQQKRWYQDTFWVIFFLIVFWPVGLFCLWKTDWSIAIKIVLTIVVAVMVIIAFNLSLQVNASLQG